MLDTGKQIVNKGNPVSEGRWRSGRGEGECILGRILSNTGICVFTHFRISAIIGAQKAIGPFVTHSGEERKSDGLLHAKGGFYVHRQI
jgi:hypothetical protein